MTARVEVLWLRALRVADARGLLPANKSALTPAELAAAVARHGDDRLVRLVEGWYYPASYGRASGALSDDEAGRLVALLEAEFARAEIAPPELALPPVKKSPRRRDDCQLCGAPIS